MEPEDVVKIQTGHLFGVSVFSDGDVVCHLVNRSTTTRMALKPRVLGLESEVPEISEPGGFDSGSPVIKSIETELHRTTGTCKGLSNP